MNTYSIDYYRMCGSVASPNAHANEQILLEVAFSDRTLQ